MKRQKKAHWIQQVFYACIFCIILYIFWRFPWHSSKTHAPKIGFNYHNIDDWTHNYPTCGSNRQSPMNLMESYVNWTDERNNTYEVLISTNFDETPVSVKLTNLGYTMKVSFEWGQKVPTITGGILPDHYQFDSLVFHWDSRNNEGSEHIITTQRSPLEVQLIFYKVQYGSYMNAKNFYDGLAIMSDLFGFEPKNYKKMSTIGINRIFEKLFDIQYPGLSINLQPFSLNQFRFVDYNELKLFMYYGSLTIPPCTENVIWIINAHEFYISEQQMQDLQTIVKFWNGNTHNHRELQPVNGRFLYGI